MQLSHSLDDIQDRKETVHSGKSCSCLWQVKLFDLPTINWQTLPQDILQKENQTALKISFYFYIY